MCDSFDSEIDSSLGDPGLSVVGEWALGDWGDWGDWGDRGDWGDLGDLILVGDFDFFGDLGDLDVFGERGDSTLPSELMLITCRLKQYTYYLHIHLSEIFSWPSFYEQHKNENR